MRMADSLIKTDRLSATSPPQVFVKDNSLSVHNSTNHGNHQHQCKSHTECEETPSLKQRAQLCCMSTLCVCVCVQVRGCEHNHTYRHLQFLIMLTAVMRGG